MKLIEIPKKRIAIIGGAGSIGSQILLRLLEERSTNIEIWDSDESRMHTLYLSLRTDLKQVTRYRLVDIRNSNSVYNAFYQFKPQIIIHAAALKHVSILEDQPFEAFMSNIVGTLNIARNAKEFKVERALFVSSDKAANPVNVLGKTKLIGEYIWSHQAKSQNSHGAWPIVRFGNVFMSRGSVVETFISQIENSLPITITHPKMSRYFMDLFEASKLICFILDSNMDGISILKMGDPIFIEDLAKRLFLYYGKEPNIEYIGVKKGEKLSEDLFSDSEFVTVKDKDFFLNCPVQKTISLDSFFNQLPLNDESALILINEILTKL